MKTLLTVITFALLSTGAMAQKASKPATKKAPQQSKAETAVTYRCPACSYSSTKPGDCPKDHVSLVKVGDYYCPKCYMSNSKPGKCEMCGVDMVKMEAVAKK